MCCVCALPLKIFSKKIAIVPLKFSNNKCRVSYYPPRNFLIEIPAGLAKGILPFSQIIQMDVVFTFHE